MMNETPIPPDREKQLAERLRADATHSQLPFSAELHEQILRAIREEKPQDKKQDRVFTGRFRPFAARFVQATLAVSLFVVASLYVWRGGPSNTEQIVNSPEVSPLAEFDALTLASDQTVSDVGAFLDSALADRQWVHLDDDAEAAAQLLLDSFPFGMLVAVDKEPDPMQ